MPARMEKFLDKALEDIINTDGVAGCIVSDKQGLCLGSRGTASPESSGLLTAISQYAKKLHPNEPTPTVVLENDEKQCIIQSNDKLLALHSLAGTFSGSYLNTLLVGANQRKWTAVTRKIALQPQLFS